MNITHSGECQGNHVIDNGPCIDYVSIESTYTCAQHSTRTLNSRWRWRNWNVRPQGTTTTSVLSMTSQHSAVVVVVMEVKSATVSVWVRAHSSTTKSIFCESYECTGQYGVKMRVWQCMWWRKWRAQHPCASVRVGGCGVQGQGVSLSVTYKIETRPGAKERVNRRE